MRDDGATTLCGLSPDPSLLTDPAKHPSPNWKTKTYGCTPCMIAVASEPVRHHGPAGADQYDSMDDWYDDACARGCTFGNANGTRLAQDPTRNNACVGVWTHAAQRGWLERPKA